MFLGPSVHSGDAYDHRFPISKLLTLSEPELYSSTLANYWLAPNRKTGVGFILDLGVAKEVRHIFLVNCKNGRIRDRATRQFKVFLSLNGKGPWTEVLHHELQDTRRMDAVPSNRFSIKPTVAKFVKFTLLSYWGHGGGLQYFSCQSDTDTSNRPGTQKFKSGGRIDK